MIRMVVQLCNGCLSLDHLKGAWVDDRRIILLTNKIHELNVRVVLGVG